MNYIDMKRSGGSKLMNALKIRKNTISIIILTAILISAVFTGVVNARYVQPSAVYKTSLSKVRAFAPAVEPTDVSYAVEGGALFAGSPQGWTAVSTPENVIVGSVVVDKKYTQTVYIGAANEMAVYRTVNNGKDWLRVPLTTDIIGGATDLAMDSNQRILYVGTDNAGVFRLRERRFEHDRERPSVARRAGARCGGRQHGRRSGFCAHGLASVPRRQLWVDLVQRG